MSKVNNVDMPYVLIKDGYFYRHNSCGYTDSIYEAELYDKDHALKYIKAHDDVSAKPADDFTNIIKIGEHLDRLNAINKALVAQLEKGNE